MIGGRALIVVRFIGVTVLPIDPDCPLTTAPASATYAVVPSGVTAFPAVPLQRWIGASALFFLRFTGVTVSPIGEVPALVTTRSCHSGDLRNTRRATPTAIYAPTFPVSRSIGVIEFEV